jgi:hypothetical protein
VQEWAVRRTSPPWPIAAPQRRRLLENLTQLAKFAGVRRKTSPGNSLKNLQQWKRTPAVASAGRHFAIFLSIAIAQPFSALGQTLPQTSTITGTLYRAPDGTIAVSPPDSAAQRSPTLPRASVHAPPTIAIPSDKKPSPPAVPIVALPRQEQLSAGAQPTRSADSPDEWDKASCRSVAWEALDQAQCWSNLKAARRHLPTIDQH